MDAGDYPLIRAYGRHLRRPAHYTGAQVDRAVAEGAPADAVHWFDGRWYCADDIKNETTRRALGLPPREDQG